jgi:CDP-2,3-bis-(O-geranylgeranyl)-sn-glycerol synthase
VNQDAIVQAVFLLIAMSVAGVAHVLWLRTSLSRRFAWPVDGGLRFRGRRVFGENKRVCGFMVLPLATALTFLILGGGREKLLPVFADSLWPLTAWQYAGLGLVCGLAFMLAELPNSFVKRQLDIAPGQAPKQAWLRSIVLLVDRYDSVLGVLLVLSLMVPVSFATWVWVLLLGPVVHAIFSIAMHSLGIKARAL